jgi:hypothetical protein
VEAQVGASVTATDETESTGGAVYSLQCGWCKMEVVCFVGPPPMGRVSIGFDIPGWRDVEYSICTECYAEFFRFISSRHQRS